MKWRVLISAPYILPVIEEFRARLEAEGVEIVTAPVKERLSEDQLLLVAPTVDGAICGDDLFTAQVLQKAPRLRVISKWGTGIDSIDTAAARKLGVRVFNTPNAFTDPVADTTLGYILCFARRLWLMDGDIRRGVWNKRDALSLGECTLGIVGVGNIGKAVVLRAHAFGMRLLGNDPVSPPAPLLEQTGLRMAPLAVLLEQADFVSLHCDLNPTSFHLIDRAALLRMRQSAHLINTARGPVVDEPALVDALRERRIAGAALDVFETEPLPADSPLRCLDNCMLAPHNANNSFAARRRVHESTVANLLKGLRELA